MELKPDGRQYSRVTRRCVAIIQHIRKGRSFSAEDICKELQDLQLPEFFLLRFDRPMSLVRIRAYVRYLIDLQVILEQGDKYTLSFEKRDRADEWAQALSDVALPHLAAVLGEDPAKLPGRLQGVRTKLLKSGNVPTLDAIIANLGVSGSRTEEVFRWSLYIYTDGDACRLDIRRYPVLLSR